MYQKSRKYYGDFCVLFAFSIKTGTFIIYSSPLKAQCIPETPVFTREEKICLAIVVTLEAQYFAIDFITIILLFWKKIMVLCLLKGFDSCVPGILVLTAMTECHWFVKNRKFSVLDVETSVRRFVLLPSSEALFQFSYCVISLYCPSWRSDERSQDHFIKY